MERIQVPSKLISIIITISLLSFLYLPGCSNSKPGSDEINKQINVYGAALFSKETFQVINGAIPRKEPCLHGYENIYDQLDLSIGYNKSGYIRKITTMNKNTDMFGIKPGELFLSGKEKIIKKGFTRGDTDYDFRKDWCSLTLLVDENKKIFGMRIEVVE